MLTEPPRVSGVWHTNYKLAGHLPFQPTEAKLWWVLRVWLLCQRIWKLPSDQLNRMFLCTMWSILTTRLAGQCWIVLSHVVLSSNAFLTISTHLPWVFSCAQQNSKSSKYPEISGCLFVVQPFVCWHLWISESMCPKTLPQESLLSVRLKLQCWWRTIAGAT